MELNSEPLIDDLRQRVCGSHTRSASPRRSVGSLPGCPAVPDLRPARCALTIPQHWEARYPGSELAVAGIWTWTASAPPIVPPGEAPRGGLAWSWWSDGLLAGSRGGVSACRRGSRRAPGRSASSSRGSCGRAAVGRSRTHRGGGRGRASPRDGGTGADHCLLGWRDYLVNSVRYPSASSCSIFASTLTFHIMLSRSKADA